jgi:PAS domain S-box-containing protein
MSKRTSAKIDALTIGEVSQSLIQQLHRARIQNAEQRTVISDLQSQLKLARQRYEELLKLVPAGCLTLDRRGCIQAANEAAVEMLSTDDRGIHGKPFAAFVSKKDFRFYLDQLQRCIFEKRQITEEITLTVRGRDIPVQMSLTSAKEHERICYYMALLDHSAMKASEQMRQLSARLDAVREEERARVAREIHDELGQSLTALKMELTWLDKQVPNRALREQVGAMVRSVDDNIRLVRRIASDLRPSLLDHLGLIAAVEWQLQEVQKRTGIQSALRRRGEPVDLGRERSTALFRIVQEALTNVVRHSGATRVFVEIDFGARQLQLSVIDNGRGISDIKGRDSLGLVGMRERAHRLGGRFEIESKPGAGTKLIVRLPMLHFSATD